MRLAIAVVMVMLGLGGGRTSTSAQPTGECYTRDDNPASAPGRPTAGLRRRRAISKVFLRRRFAVRAIGRTGLAAPRRSANATRSPAPWSRARHRALWSERSHRGRGRAPLKNCPIVAGERACLTAPSNADPSCYTTSAPTCAGDTPMNACDPEALSAQCRPSESAFTTCSNQ